MASLCSRLGHWLQSLWNIIHRQKHIEGNVLSTELRRCLTTADLVLIGLGHMMGAGIYIISGQVMKNEAGASTTLAFVFAGVAAILGGLCYAQFSVNVPKTGTAYNYVYFIFGEIWGFLSGWNLILEYLILVASVGRSLSAYIDALADGAIQNATNAAVGTLDSSVFGPVDFLGAGLIILFFIIIAIGVRSSVNVNNGMTVVNVVVILIIFITSISIGSVENFNEDHGGFFPYGFGGTMSATGIVFFAYVGFDAIAVAAEETKNPSKSMPLGIIIAVSIVTFLYCSASFGLSLLLPYNEIDEGAPFPNAFKRYGLQWATYAVTVGAIFGMIASLLGQAFCLPRGIYAIATDGLLFHPLTYVNSWTKTPLVSIAVSAIFAALLAMFVKIADLVEMVSIGTLFSMTLMTGSLLKLHYIPASIFPFELKIDGKVICPEDTREVNERTPVTPKPSKSQTLGSIGQLRFDVPYLNKKDANTVTSVVIWILMTASIGLTAVVIRGWTLLSQGNWILIVLFVLFLLAFVCCLVTLLMYEHNRSFAKFSVPLVPWMPVLTLIVNLSLMMVLHSATWIRLIVWIAIGLVIYFAYGIRHSSANRDNYIEMTDEMTDVTSITTTNQSTASNGTFPQHS